MAKIAFDNKVDLTVKPIPEINKLTASNINEIKTVVNGLDDEKISLNPSGNDLKVFNEKGIPILLEGGVIYDDINKKYIITEVVEKILIPVAVGSPVTHHENTITSLDKENEYYVDLSTDVNILELNLPEVTQSTYMLLKARVQGDPASINRRIKFLSTFSYEDDNLTGSDSLSNVGIPLAANTNASFFYLYYIIISIDIISPTKKILRVSYQTTANGIPI